MGADIALKAENLCYKYPDGSLAIQNISFEIEKGQKVFFHGENGAGKTTLFQCLCGLLKVAEGTVYINGAAVRREKERMRLIGVVFQNANDQIIAGSVFDEISFGPLNMGVFSADEVLRRVDAAMKTMNIEHLRDKPPHFLSGGQKKSVAIASILSMEPEIIIFDEPTSGLDMHQTEEFIHIINELADSGKTLLISTHSTDFSYRCADKIIVMNAGKIIADGLPQNVFLQSGALEKASLYKPFVMEIAEMMNFEAMPTDRKGLLKAIEQGRGSV